MRIPFSQRWKDRLRSPLTVRVAGLTILVFIVVGELVTVGIDWKTLTTARGSIASDKRTELDSLTAAIAPMRGLDKRVSETQTQIDAFRSHRLLTTYSSIAKDIGQLEMQSGVHFSQVAYGQRSRGTDLSEIMVDANISGDYPQIMRFVNGLERDETFFVIRSMTLAGQQTGPVNLQIRFSTWLRSADATASGIPAAPAPKSVVDPSTDTRKKE